MPFDDEADDEPSGSGVPLPADDRLWRHPSELGALGRGSTPGSDPLNTPWPPLAALDLTGSASHRRTNTVALVAVSCLAGAVISLGVTLATRPTRVVERPLATHRASAVTNVSFGSPAAPTERLAAEIGPSVARIAAKIDGRWASGAGALIDRDGTIVTAASLVFGASEVIATFGDGAAHRGRILGIDGGSGLAVVRISGERPAPLLMTGALPGVGAPVTLVGAPALSAGHVTTTVSTGVVRAVGRQLDGPTGPLQGVIEIDRDVLPDTDGGVLTDQDGHVVGVALSGKVANGIGAVVPAAMTRQVVGSLEATGRVSQAWLGVSATDLDADSAMRMRVQGGAIVTAVTEQSPADVAKIVPGDVLLDLGDHPIASTADVVVALRQLEPGQHAVLVLVRDGRRMTMTITLGGR